MRVWEAALDEQEDRDCMYGGETAGCTHYRLTWSQNLEGGGWIGGSVGTSDKGTIEFLRDAANAAEAARSVRA